MNKPDAQTQIILTIQPKYATGEDIREIQIWVSTDEHADRLEALLENSEYGQLLDAGHLCYVFTFNPNYDVQEVQDWIRAEISSE